MLEILVFSDLAEFQGNKIGAFSSCQSDSLDSFCSKKKSRVDSFRQDW